MWQDPNNQVCHPWKCFVTQRRWYLKAFASVIGGLLTPCHCIRSDTHTTLFANANEVFPRSTQKERPWRFKKSVQVAKFLSREKEMSIRDGNTREEISRDQQNAFTTAKLQMEKEQLCVWKITDQLWLQPDWCYWNLYQNKSIKLSAHNNCLVYIFLCPSVRCIVL